MHPSDVSENILFLTSMLSLQEDCSSESLACIVDGMWLTQSVNQERSDVAKEQLTIW